MSVPQPPVDGIPQPPEGTRISPESASSYQKLQTEASEAARAYNVYQAERGEYERQKAVLEREGLLRKNKVYIRSDRDRTWYQKLQEQGSRVNVAAERYEKEVSDYESLKSQYKQVGLIKDDQFIFNLENITPKISIIKAGPTIKTSDYPSPQATQPTAQSSGVERQLKQTIDENPLFLGLVAKPAVDAFLGVLSGITYPWDTSSAQSKYEGAVNAYEKKYTEAEKAGLIVNGEFLIANPTAELRYKEIQIAADAVNQSEKELKETQKQELFGIPARFHDIEKGLASTLNLPPLSPDQARTITKLQNPGTLLASHLTGYQNPVTEIQAGVLSGAYSGVRDRPLTGAASFGVGLVGGLAVKGATKIPMIGQAVGKALPPTLKLAEGAWVGSIGARAGISGYSGGLFAAGETLGGILTTEAVPVMAGGALAMRDLPKLSSTRTPGEMRLWAENVPEPVRMEGGWRPSEAMIEEGLPQLRAQRRGEVPVVTSRDLSPSRAGKAGKIVEVEPGKYIGKEYEAQYRRLVETGTTGQEPIPPEHLHPPDLESIPFSRYIRAEVAIPRELPKDSIAGGWRPSEAMIEEGLPQLRALRRGELPIVTSRSLSPSRAGKIVEVEPGKYIGKEYEAQYRRLVETGTTGQEPIPPEHLHPPDLESIPSGWEPGLITESRPFYSGLPIIKPSRIRSTYRPPTSRSGRSPMIRPSRTNIRVEQGVSSTIRPILTSQLSSDTLTGLIQVPTPRTMMQIRATEEAALKERQETAKIIEPEIGQITRSDVGLKVMSVQEVSLKSDQESMRITIPISRIDIQTRSKIERTPKVGTKPLFEPPPRPTRPIRFGSDEKTKKKRKRDPGDVLAWEVRNKVPKMEDIFGPTKPSKRSRSATTTNMADTAAEIRRITAINPYKSNKKGNKRR